MDFVIVVFKLVALILAFQLCDGPDWLYLNPMLSEVYCNVSGKRMNFGVRPHVGILALPWLANVSPVKWG